MPSSTRLIPAVLLIAVAVMTSGCMTMREGRPFDATRIPELRVGVTTRAEVVAMFGEPQTTERRADGVEHLTYRHSVTTAKPDARQFIPIVGIAYMGGKMDTKTSTLTVAVKDDKVVDYRESNDSHGGAAKAWQ